jgi:hypothetical protein
MINKETFTKIFLKEANKSIDTANIKLHLHKWWQSHRNKNSGGLRLTEEGLNFLSNELQIKSYTVPFTEEIDLSPQVIIFFDRHMDCPYFLTNSAIIVFSERKSFELYMFSDDIRKFGLVKAINRQNQSNQTEE